MGRGVELSAEKRVVCLAGMAGAGKSLVVAVGKANGYGVVVMGDVVREEAATRHLEPTPENIGRLMLELRQKEGNSVIARKCVTKIENTKENTVIIDGIRSLDEVNEFKKRFSKLTLIAVHAPPETRFKRLYHRQRTDDPQDWRIFQERDTRELSVGLGNAIAMAEHLVVNEERPDAVKARIREVLKRVEQKWMK